MEARTDPWSAAAIEQNRQWLTAYVLALTGDPGAPDDLVQETFAIALAKRGEFRSGTNFGGWLRGIARNVSLRHCERRGREVLIPGDEAMQRLDRAAGCAEADDAALGAKKAMAAALRRCLEELSARTRRLLDLRYGRGLSSAEAGAEVGQSVSAVNVTLFRARAVLAECINRKGGRP